MGRLSPGYVLWHMLNSLSLSKRSPVNRQPSICDVLVICFFFPALEGAWSVLQNLFLFSVTLWWLFSHLQQPFIWYFSFSWQFHANCLCSTCRSWNTSASGPTYKQGLAFPMCAGYQHISSCPQEHIPWLERCFIGTVWKQAVSTYMRVPGHFHSLGV